MDHRQRLELKSKISPKKSIKIESWLKVGGSDVDSHNSVGAENGSSLEIAGVGIQDLTKETYNIES